MLVPLAFLSGCASTDPPGGRSAERICTTEDTAWALGRPADEATGRKLFRDSGAGLWRIIIPGQAVRADRRGDRLTVRVDKQNVITSIHCE